MRHAQRGLLHRARGHARLRTPRARPGRPLLLAALLLAGAATCAPAVRAQDAALDLDTTISLTGACPGEQLVQVAPAHPVTLCYLVTNSGSTHLVDIQVTDDLLGPVCGIAGPLAPGAMQTCSLATTAGADAVHVGTAQGQPSDPLGQPLGQPPVDLSDDAELDVLVPGIAVQKTVYSGHDGGGGCAASGERAAGGLGDPVTYCFALLNIGEASLEGLTLADPALGVDRSAMTLVDGVEPLVPGATITFTLEAAVTADLVNTVMVSGAALNDAGDPLPGADPPQDSDSAQVELAAPDLDLVLGLSTDGLCPGLPALSVISGSPVTYCYRATNLGDTPLLNLRVTDDRLGFICGARGPLLPGEERLCTRSEPAGASALHQATAQATPSDAAGLPWPGLPTEAATSTAELTLLPATVCLGNLVFYDLDNDGRFEPAQGEFGIAGATIQAWADEDASGGLSAGDSLAGTTSSAGAGAYQLCGLAPGDYVVVAEAVQFVPGGVLDGLVSSSGNDRFGQPPDPDDDQDGDDNGGLHPGGAVVTRAVGLQPGTEPDAAVDGDGRDANSTVDLGFIRLESPTGLHLTRLAVEAHGGGLRLRWAARADGALLGFRIRRAAEARGPWLPVGPALIPAPPERSSGEQHLDDRPGPGTWFYRLEALAADGRVEGYGPLSARLERSRLFLPRLSALR